MAENDDVRAALLAAVAWWETIVVLRDASNRPVSFGMGYEPGWLKQADAALAETHVEH